MIAIVVTAVAALAAVLGLAVWQYPPRDRLPSDREHSAGDRSLKIGGAK